MLNVPNADLKWRHHCLLSYFSKEMSIWQSAIKTCYCLLLPSFFFTNSPVSLWLLAHVPSLSVRVHLLSQSIAKRKKISRVWKNIYKAVLIYSMHEEDYPSHNKDNKTVESLWNSSQKSEKYDQNSDEWIPLGWMAGGWIGRMDKMNDTRM